MGKIRSSKTWLKKVKKKKLRKIKRLEKLKKLKRVPILQFCELLEKNLPKSEEWFRDLWRRSEMEHTADQYNRPLCGFIPDVQNSVYNYVIEIDGSIHNQKKQRQADQKKNAFYTHRGVFWVRVKAFDFDSFNEAASLIDWHRSRLDSERATIRSKKPLIILRKAHALNPLMKERTNEKSSSILKES